MQASNIPTSVTATDFDASRAWYARLFGRGPDHCPNTSCAEWQIARRATIRVHRHDPCETASRRSGTASIGILVKDLDTMLSQMRSRQIDIPAPQPATQFLRFAPVTDPDGNRLTFVESITR